MECGPHTYVKWGKNNKYSWELFPLILPWAVTLRILQGSAYHRLLFADIGDSNEENGENGISYVASSRAAKLNNK